MPKTRGYESLYEEAVNFALNETYPKAVDENKLFVVNQPNIDIDFNTLDKDKGFTYTATVDVLPAFELGAYKGLEVKKASEKASAKEVKENIERTLKAKAENVVKEDAAVNGDTVVIDFEGFIDDVAFEGGKGENYPLEIGSNTFIPGFEEALIGLKKGDKTDVKVTFPENYHSEELKGKPVIFKVEVKEVKERVFPEFNKEFFEDLNVGGVTSLEDLKNYIKENKEAEKTRQVEDEYLFKCLDKVVADSKFEIPEEMTIAEVYDLVKCDGLYDLICSEIEDDIKYIFNLISQTAKEIYTYRTSLVGIMEKITSDYGALSLDAEQIKQNLDNPEGLELLRNIMDRFG